MAEQEQKRTAAETIEIYQGMRRIRPDSSILREVRGQYIDMAAGGEGGPTWAGALHSCRGYNYPDYPDSFFAQVCEGMGWK